MTEPAEARGISWYAAAIDRAATSTSILSMAHAIRDEVDVPLFDDLPPDASPDLLAVCWVFDYAVDFSSTNARLVPRVDSTDQPDPPPIKTVADDVRQIWRNLLEVVTAPSARARLAHAVFQCGGTGGLVSAKTAIENYIVAAGMWERPFDRDEYLRIAARIARIIGDHATAIAAIDQLLTAAEEALENEPSGRPGLVLRPLTYAVNEPACPARVDELLDQAATKLADARDRDRALQLIFQRCTNSESRSAVWRRRVDNYLTAADDGTGVVKVVLRQEALKLAEASANREL